MVVMILEKVPAALRGELTRWLMEVKKGVYIGHISALVRDKLWEKCSNSRRNGAVFQAWSTNNEQHFNLRLVGCPNRAVRDWEGLLLVEETCPPLTEIQKRRIKAEV